MPFRSSNPNCSHRGERGYMLLILMFFVALLAFSMMAVLPRVAQQVKRDREEEMIHRGTEYARAVKKYYKKFNKYPNSIEDLENTNNIRFLRKRYKDPMSPEGNWKLLHITDVQQGISNPNFGVSQAGNFNPAQGGAGGQTVINIGGGGAAPGNSVGQGISLGGADNAGNNNPSTPSLGAAGAQPTPDASGTATATSGTASSTSTQSPASPALGGQTGQTYGAGGIVGVASVSKTKSVREFDRKNVYNKWMFIYDPTQDKGTLLKGPYNPQAFQGTANNSNPNGTQGQQPGQPGAFGTGSSFGPNSNQQQQSGPQNNMPPDQNAPPQ